MNQKGFKKVATLCVLKHKNKFLLLKRFNKPNAGKYVPVGGKLKPYESPKNGVIRETLEETGLKIKNPIFAGILSETSPTNYNWMSYVFYYEINFINPPLSNEGVLKWIHYKDINKADLKKDLHELIEAGLSLSAASKYLAKKNGIKKSIIYNLN